MIQPAKGVGPTISFLKVPESKVVKNRVHLDVKVSGGRNVEPQTRERRIRTKKAELVAAGASTLSEDHVAGSLDHLVMADPEGNEFCIVRLGGVEGQRPVMPRDMPGKPPQAERRLGRASSP